MILKFGELELSYLEHEHQNKSVIDHGFAAEADEVSSLKRPSKTAMRKSNILTQTVLMDFAMNMSV